MHPLEIPITKVLKLDMIRKSGTIRSEVHASCIVYFVVNVISYVMWIVAVSLVCQVVQLLIIARDNDSTPADVKEAVEKSIVSDI